MVRSGSKKQNNLGVNGGQFRIRKKSNSRLGQSTNKAKMNESIDFKSK